METRTVIDTATSDIIDSVFGAEIEDDFIIAENTESYAILAEYFEVSVELVREIASGFEYLSESIKKNISKDLRDIWKRLDGLEK